MPDLMDDATRIYYIFDDQGNIVSQRPYTADENKQVDDEIAGRLPDQQAVDRAMLRGIIVDLKAEKDRAQTVLDDTTSSKQEKDLARSVRRIADSAIDLAKYARRS